MRRVDMASSPDRGGLVRLADVAREAGVSTATASRALNGHSTVDPALAAKVRAVAQSLGYRPNAVARNLRTRNTRVWALIISDVTNPFFTSVARGVEDIAREQGFSVFLCNTDEDAQRESDYLSVAEQENVAGIIISPHSAETRLNRLAVSGVPIVVIDRRVDADVDTVLVNSRDGATSATEHLLSQGWKTPACITGPRDAITSVDRAEGYEAALRRRDISSVARVEYEDYRVEGGRAAARRLLDLPDAPDSFLAANAALAMGVLEEFRARGIRAGRDVGLVSFDDAPWASIVEPPLTVVAQPAYEIGSQAANMLIEQLSGARRGATGREISLGTSLIVRGSSIRSLSP